MTLPELNGRNILVTGGAHGIGAAIVRGFHAQGACVSFCDKDVAPEEIADVVLFLASDASRAITGQELLVDRGWCYS